MDDLFLKIISGDIPSAKIYEDDIAIAFLDIKPNNKGHALVVPRTKFRNIFDADPSVLGHMMEVAQKVACVQKEILHAEGVNIVMNNEPAANQEIFHAHIHVIPRFAGDNVFQHSNHTTYADGEIEEVAERMKRSIK
jgi:histidine triad (HIT) family protein